MKNLFKSLMFVAVAAMTFTACEKESNDVNKNEQKAVIEFTADFENDTRSGFASEKDGENYKSVWYGNESITVIVTDATDATNKVTGWGSVDALPEDVESSESAHFEVELNGELPTSGTIEVFVGEWMTYGTVAPNIREEQRYTDYSVGSASHISKSNKVEYTDGVPSNVSVTFTPEVAFGKITMNQFDAADISKVVVTLNDSIEYTLAPEFDTVMTLPVAWFACEADLVVNSISVCATVDGVEYIKSVEGLNVTFNKNKVRPINVTGMTEKPADYEVELTKVTAINGNTISFAGENPQDMLTIVFNPGLAEIQEGVYNAASAGLISLDPYEYGTMWTSTDALEFGAYNETTFNLSSNYNEYGHWPNGGVVTVSIDGTTYTIVALLKDSGKTYEFTYTGALEVATEDEGGEVVATTFNYYGRWDDYYGLTQKSSGVYKLIGDNFDIDFAIHYTGYDQATGALVPGTYTYGYNWGYYPGNGSGYDADSALYEGYFTFAGTLNGSALTANYDSTLVVTDSGITLTVVGGDPNPFVITAGQPTKVN